MEEISIQMREKPAAHEFSHTVLHAHFNVASPLSNKENSSKGINYKLQHVPIIIVPSLLPG